MLRTYTRWGKTRIGVSGEPAADDLYDMIGAWLGRHWTHDADPNEFAIIASEVVKQYALERGMYRAHARRGR